MHHKKHHAGCEQSILGFIDATNLQAEVGANPAPGWCVPSGLYVVSHGWFWNPNDNQIIKSQQNSRNPSQKFPPSKPVVQTLPHCQQATTATLMDAINANCECKRHNQGWRINKATRPISLRRSNAEDHLLRNLDQLKSRIEARKTKMTIWKKPAWRKMYLILNMVDFSLPCSFLVGVVYRSVCKYSMLKGGEYMPRWFGYLFKLKISSWGIQPYFKKHESSDNKIYKMYLYYTYIKIYLTFQRN